MKGNKKLLIVAVLLLLVAVSYSTYAIYKSSATGTGSVTAAAWVVNVGSTDIVANNTFTLGTITWDNPMVGQNNTIAPGDTGTVDIVIDADGSQVAVDYNIELDDTNLNNQQFIVDADQNSPNPLSGTIAYSSTDHAMEKTVKVRIVWDGEDSETANGQDIALQGTQISLPIKVTVVQNPDPSQ